jgi:TRAP-type uncharacterized transport system fused permease subunit
LCAYVAAGIAKADPVKTGLKSFKLDAAAFTLPFLFVYNPQLLLININFFRLLKVLAGAIIGMILFGAAIQGFLLVKTKLWERILLFLIAIFLIKPGILTDLVGALGLGLIVTSQVLRRRKSARVSSEVQP